MNRKEITNNNGVSVTFEIFNGINEFLNVYEKAPVSDAYKKHYISDSLMDEKYTKSRKIDTGVSGYPDAVEKMKNGVNVAAMKTARAAAATGTKRTVVHSVNGGRVSVPSYLCGSPKCMRRARKKPVKTELNIFVDTSVSAYIKENQITTAGALIVGYITELEQKYNVNLYAGEIAAYNDTTRIKENNIHKFPVCGFGIKIKDAGKPFSAARVSFCLTSPAFLRVFGFIWNTRADGVPYDGGLGTPLSINKNYESETLKKVFKNTVIISVFDVIKHGAAALPKM